MALSFSRVDLEQFKRIVFADKLVWLVAPWDTDGEAFLSYSQHLKILPRLTYHINCHGYTESSSFEEAMQSDLNIYSTDLSRLLLAEEDVTVIFDNIQVHKYSSGLSMFSEVRNISELLVKTCPNLTIVLKTTHDIANAGLDPVALKVMDEVNCSRYVLGHPWGYRVTEADLAGGEIYLITRGSSRAIDKLLERLEYMELSEIAAENSDAALHNIDVEDIPEALKLQIDRLQSSTEDFSYDLLKCLSIFPYGEDISNLKNFDKDRMLYPRMGGPLVKLGLAEGLRFFIFRNEATELPKVIVAKTLVQDYVRSKLNKDEYKDLTSKALTLYFSADWKLGKPKLSGKFSLESLNHSTFAIRNANTLLRRVFNDAIETNNSREIQDSLNLLSHYTRKLISAHQYRYVVSLCHVIYPSLQKLRDDHFVKEILFSYGKSLRMVREFVRSIDVMTDLLAARALTIEFESKIYIDLALSYDEKGDSADAINAANQALLYREEGALFFQAHTILTCLNGKGNKRRKLIELRNKCKNRRYFIAANNISMRIERLFGLEEEAHNAYKKIADTAKKCGDIYNFIRATIFYSKKSVTNKIHLSDKEMKDLFFAYHVVYSQRLTTLFYEGHYALWFEYERLREITMLVSLFKQCSLIFRVNADESNERYYLSRLLGGNIAPPEIIFSLVSLEDRKFLMERLQTLKIASSEKINSLEPATLEQDNN
ncbi:hypothetical protein [Pseudomonas sp. 58 R 12]|uniref:hypothetical protein n=1 Tax=Pseudomonas sp. 58 R 12 TaxID=1844107 RepID=UPI00081C1490|nr:hypothetical protein [Pseudomonas sp. 58 R 12]